MPIVHFAGPEDKKDAKKLVLAIVVIVTLVLISLIVEVYSESKHGNATGHPTDRPMHVSDFDILGQSTFVVVRTEQIVKTDVRRVVLAAKGTEIQVSTTVPANEDIGLHDLLG